MKISTIVCADGFSDAWHEYNNKEHRRKYCNVIENFFKSKYGKIENPEYTISEIKIHANCFFKKYVESPNSLSAVTAELEYMIETPNRSKVKIENAKIGSIGASVSFQNFFILLFRFTLLNL